MSKTWEVFTQSSEPEAHVKNARQTKKYKTGWPLAYINTIIKKFSHRSSYDWSGNFKQLEWYSVGTSRLPKV